MLNDEDIVEELSKVGIEISGIYDLVNTKEKYPQAIPILIDLVKKEFSNINVREGIIRALTVKEAKGLANDTLLKIYSETPIKDHFFRWAIGNAFSVIITEADVAQILRIVQNKNNGTSRQIFVIALGKVKKTAEIEKTLMNLLDDNDVSLHAIVALRNIKSLKAKRKIEKLLNSERSIIRKEAKKYLERFEKWTAK